MVGILKVICHPYYTIITDFIIVAMKMMMIGIIGVIIMR